MVSVLLGEMGSIDSALGRQNLVRIPEVISAIKKLQESLDAWAGNESPDLFSIYQSESFESSGEYRSLLTTVTLWALYQRFRKYFGEPNMLIAPKSALDALALASGQQSIASLVETRYLPGTLARLPKATRDVTFEVLVKKAGVWEVRDVEAVDSNGLIEKLYLENEITRIVTVGPNQKLVNKYEVEPSFESLRIEESIEIDPSLNWFWSQPRQLVS